MTARPHQGTRGILVALLLACGALKAAPVDGSLASAAARSAPVPVVEETFDDDDAVRDFRTSGRGTWAVDRGKYRLDTPAGAWARRTNQSLSVRRMKVAAQRWRVRTTARPRVGQPADFSLLFGYRSPRSYDYVHFDGRRGRSAVVRVRDGVQQRVSTLHARIAPGRAYAVELRRTGTRLGVFLGRTRGSLRKVGSARVTRGHVLRAGYGSRLGDVAFDNLMVTAPGTPPGPATGPPPLVDPPPGGRAVDVSTSEELTAALADARPGDVITMSDGVYTTKGLKAPLVIGDKQYVGTFVASVSGTTAMPIVLQGTPAAVIDGKPGEVGTGTQYGLYLAAADHWRVTGITVTNVSKGIVLDRSSHSAVEGVVVHTVGQEAIHLRSFSSDNLVRGNVVRDTGLKNETYGEGIYVGSANSNWTTYSDGRPDASNDNRIIGNHISRTSAESMDIKEGTTGGLIQGNVFDGAGMSGSWADSWIDMKGSGWQVVGNTGTNAKEDGFQVHGALAGWGLSNVFRGNTARVNGPGYGFWLQNNVTGNVVACSNSVTGAASGFVNAGICTP